MRKEINIKKAAEKIITDRDQAIHKQWEVGAKMNMLILEVLLDIRDKIDKQNEMIRRNGRT